MNSSAQKSPAKPTASLQYWKWRILLATMACYLFYYCGRFNLAICMKPISEEFGWDKAQRGLASLGRNQRKKVSSQFGMIGSLFVNTLLFTTKAKIP